LRAAQSAGYLSYSEADLGVFRPAGATRCTDGGEIWHRQPGEVPSSMSKFTIIGATITVYDHKTEIFTEIWSKCGIQTPRRGISCAIFTNFLKDFYPVSRCVSC